MTPLAAEILADLDPHFPDGAGVHALMKWLGEGRRETRAALRELVAAGEIYAATGGRYFTGAAPKRRLDNGARDAAVIRLLDEGWSHGRIAHQLKLTKPTVDGISNRRRPDYRRTAA